MAPLKVRIKYGSSELTNAIVSAELGFWIVLGERYAVFFNCSISSPKIRCSTILWEAASPSNLATMRRLMRDRSSRDLTIIRQWSELGKSKDEASSSAGIIGSPLHDSITHANQMPTLAELKSLRNSQVMGE